MIGGTAMEIQVVLFESGPDEEALRVVAALALDGGLTIWQESAGPLTQFCFEESPHVVETVLDRRAVRGLAAYFHVDTRVQVLEVLRLAYTGYDCASNIRDLLKRLDLPYEVRERPISRQCDSSIEIYYKNVL